MWNWTNNLRNILLIFFGIVVALVLLEFTLGIASIIVDLPQKLSNKEFNDSNYRILVLGESTTAGDNNWPKYLESELRNVSDIYKIYNEGRMGTTSAVIVNDLEQNIAKYDPHMVITMMGINDNGMVFYNPDKKSNKLFSHMKIIKLTHWIINSIKKEKLSASTITHNSINEQKRIIIDSARKKCFIQKDYNKSIKLFIQLLSIWPDDTEIMSSISQCYIQNHKYSESIPYLINLTNKEPNNFWHHSALSVSYCKVHDYNKSKAEFIKSIKLDPSQRVAQVKHMFCFLEKGNISFEEIENFVEKYDIYVKINKTRTGKEDTMFNYRILNQMLVDKDIKHIAMQYPRKNIENLKEYYENYENYENITKICYF